MTLTFTMNMSSVTKASSPQHHCYIYDETTLKINHLQELKTTEKSLQILDEEVNTGQHMSGNNGDSNIVSMDLGENTSERSWPWNKMSSCKQIYFLGNLAVLKQKLKKAILITLWQWSRKFRENSEPNMYLHQSPVQQIVYMPFFISSLILGGQLVDKGKTPNTVHKHHFPNKAFRLISSCHPDRKSKEEEKRKDKE